MSAALAIPTPSVPPAVEDADRQVMCSRLFQTTMRIALGLTEASGNLADASTVLSNQTETIHEVVAATQQMSVANKHVADKLKTVGAKAHEIGHNVADATGRIAEEMSAARADVERLAQAANEIDVQVVAAAAQVDDLRKSSIGIMNIAREIQLLAVNAGVEAARHGASGRGFAVIAEAVKKLADQTRAATDMTEKHLVKLAATMERLQTQGQVNLESARNADAEMAKAEDRIRELLGGRDALVSVVEELERSVPHVQANADACRAVLGNLKASSGGVDEASTGIGSAVEQFQRLVGLSEDMSGILMAASSELPVSGLANACVTTAQRISQVFEAAIASGRIRMEQLFDERYRPIEGSDPQQFMTAFTAFTDQVLPEIQEPLLASDRRIMFCAAADRNGYMPTHNKRFSLPQGPDPVWNAQNARNRRIFNDRTGITSVRNRKPVLLQTYRRDMGGGVFAVINELASPIIVSGRHWGGFRIGFKL